MKFLLPLFALAFLFACTTVSETPDAGDAGDVEETIEADAGEPAEDAGEPVADAGEEPAEDAGGGDAG